MHATNVTRSQLDRISLFSSSSSMNVLLIEFLPLTPTSSTAPEFSFSCSFFS